LSLKEARMTKARPKTGEPRKSHQPLKIDLLPQAARDAIERLYDRGRTWMEISEQSGRPYSEKWDTDGGGFVPWETIELKVLEEFPELRLAKSSLHRWFDLRVSQARKEVLRESAQAREFASAFAGSDLSEANGAVINALRDQVFNLIQSAGNGDKALFAQGLKDLTLAMSRMQRVELQARRVEVDERKVAQLEQDAELKRKRFTKEMNDAEKKITRGQALTADDINRIRERVFGLGPAPTPAV
jgi:hypothetical protein